MSEEYQGPSEDIFTAISARLEEEFETQNLDAEKVARVGAAQRLVDTFSSLLNKKLWLKNAQHAYTDGSEIAAPFRHDYFYQMVEHEIAHNLFLSSFEAKELFSEKYLEMVQVAIKNHGKKITPTGEAALKEMVGTMLNILEDHRINTLWSTLYPGSYAILEELAVKLLKGVEKHAHQDLITYTLLVANKHPKIPSGRFDPLKAWIEEAVNKVAFKGPAATFVVGKWLLTKMVDEFVNGIPDEPPPKQKGKGGKAGSSGSAGKQQSQAQQQDAGGDSGDSGGTEGNDGGGEEGGEGADSDNSFGKYVPSAGSQHTNTAASKVGVINDPYSAAGASAPQATLDRIDALVDLVQNSLMSEASQKASGKARANLNDMQKARFRPMTGYQKLVENALGINVANEMLDSFLATSKMEMERTLDSIQQSLKTESRVTDDTLLTRGLTGKIIFKDIAKATRPVPRMMAEDSRTSQRLREMFRRVHMRRAKQRFDCGSEVDVETVISNKVNGLNDPCFKDEGTGRGFKAMILVDRSGSMIGENSYQTERACRILRRALKQPNVDVLVWGFQGTEKGIQISRIAPNLDVRTSDEMPCTGDTPLAQALHVATNFLREGTQKKHLLVLTDGLPNHASGDVLSYKREGDCVARVGQEVERARKKKIHVTAISVGSHIKEADMGKMFGRPNTWAIARTAEDLTPNMLSTFARSFSEFLSHA